MRHLLVILLTIIAISVKAQPKLPDISGTGEKGIVILSWDCQYDGIKAITVQRATKVATDFKTIGSVKKVGKGVQAFMDGHPGAGNNWYRLNIMFSSDLSWTSNVIKFHVDSDVIMNNKLVLPTNDTLQRFLVIEMAKPADTVGGKPHAHITLRLRDANDIPGLAEDTAMQRVLHSDIVANTTTFDSTKKTHIISTAADSANNPPPFTYVRSHYIFTNPLTGHINMEMPDTVGHKYSVKFFNDKGKEVLDVPRIAQSPIILDKHNFQHKGIYKFILKEDGKDMETGYITIY